MSTTLLVCILVAQRAFAGNFLQKTPPQTLNVELQTQLDAVIAHYKTEFPNLAISLAYKDASQSVSMASGNVSGRGITPDDTFLYGSGTKPFTATAVLRLIDSGKVKATDKVSDIINPYLREHGQPPLNEFFGDAVDAATVLELIRMGAGIRDFEDDFTFDQWVLAPENSTKFWDTYPYDAMAFASSPLNTKGKGPLYCAPGNCTAYSSTSFEVAGLVLAAVLNPSSAWYEFDLGSALFPDRSLYPSMTFPPLGNGSAKLSKYLTVAGTSVASTWEQTTIHEQSPSILGWTCGNMVAKPGDVANFFFELLGEKAQAPLLSNASRAEMVDFQFLSTGWAAHKLRYGAGLMDLYYGYPPRGGLLEVHGHEGDTYGFLSSQGYIPSLQGGYSIVTNVDDERPLYAMACYFLQTLNATITGGDSDLGCSLTVTSATSLTLVV